MALYSANEEGLKCKAVDRFTLVFRCIGIEFNIYRAHYTLNPSRGVSILVLDIVPRSDTFLESSRMQPVDPVVVDT